MGEKASSPFFQRSHSSNEPEKISLGIKGFVLLALALQNASHALVGRYSKGILQETYDATEVVMVAEVIKCIVSGIIAYHDTAETDSVGVGYEKLVWLLKNSSKTLLLVVLYGAANILTYISLANIDAATYSVLLQLKTLTTAAFAVTILSRYISTTKWRALVLLIVGCILVASPVFNSCETDSKKQSSSLVNYMAGSLAAILICILSGYAVTYFEQILKSSGEKLTIWERNFQLAFYSIGLMIIYVTFSNMQDVTRANQPMFAGWSMVTVLLSFIAAAGGLLVAACLKYADAILKTLATSMSILISTFLGHLLLDGPLDGVIILGAICTILAIFNYAFDTSPPPSLIY